MTNATAAGPSYGIIDVIFGTQQEEPKEADGQELMPFMNLIKALKEKSEDKDNASSWTDEETASGKSAVDYRAVGMPGMYPPQGGSMEQLLVKGEVATGENSDGVLAKAAALPKLKTIDPQMVNGMLEASALLPLTKQEQNLLMEVNKKIEQQNAVISRLPAPGGLALAKGENLGSEAADVLEDPDKLQLLKELNRKGVDPNVIRKAEAMRVAENPEQAATLEKTGKFLSTESYLQMHDQLAKTPGKSGANEKRLEVAEGSNPLQMIREAKSDASLLTGEDKSKEFLGNPEKHLLADPKPGRSLGKLEPGLNFAAGLLEAQRSSESLTKDIQLPSANPQEMKGILTGEVNQGVSLQALKGGGEMRLIIHPEQLGEVKVHVGTKEGKVEVKITTENEDVAKVIRGGSRELETSLRDQNLSLTKFDVSVADAGVASLDNGKGNLSDQFLQQQNPQNNFSGMFSRDDSQSSRWDNQSSHGNTRDNSSAFVAQENESKRSSSFSKQTTRAKDSSRKLDVVA